MLHSTGTPRQVARRPELWACRGREPPLRATTPPPIPLHGDGEGSSKPPALYQAEAPIPASLNRSLRVLDQPSTARLASAGRLRLARSPPLIDEPSRVATASLSLWPRNDKRDVRQTRGPSWEGRTGSA